MASEKIFAAWNGPAPTTAGQAVLATGTSIKSLIQLATPSTRGLCIIEWGISFSGFAAAQPVLVELLSCSVAATVTAYVDADISRYNQQGQPTGLTLGVSASGYNASVEGTVANVDTYDAQLIAPSSQYVKQWPLGREPDVDISRFVRVRVTAPATVNCLAYVIWAD